MALQLQVGRARRGRAPARFCVLVAVFVAQMVFANASQGADSAKPRRAGEPVPAEKGGVRLFDGKTLRGWSVTEFGGQGEVVVEEGQIMLPVGSDMTGITWSGDPERKDFKLPKEEYEIQLEAQRVEGSDFFCGLTFPVGDGFASLILGGWGGGVVGISSINGLDASENDTTQFVEFVNGRWYRIRLRVTKDRIAAWIDDKQLIDVDRKDKKFSVRVEVDLSRPLGIATWQTKGALRNIVLVNLADDAAPAEKKKEGVKRSILKSKPEKEDGAPPTPADETSDDTPQKSTSPKAPAAESTTDGPALVPQPMQPSKAGNPAPRRRGFIRRGKR